MQEKLLNLLEAIRDLPGDPADIISFVHAAPAVGSFPDPQVSWTLIGLLHYQRRKRWACRVFQERLGVQLSRPEKDWDTIQDVIESDQNGIVPGLPDWQYHLEGSDSHLIHRGTEEDLHIDTENGPTLITGREFIFYFRSNRQPGPAEQRLAQLFPRGAGCWFALKALHCHGLLLPQ